MKYLLLSVALLAFLPLFAQKDSPAGAGKGVSPLNPKSEIANPKSTRAVVIGISDYQDDKISDLKYAHRDAIAFAAWLQSPAGGNVPPERIQVLLNEKATLGKVAMSLTWLMEQSREGDRAIIYFSGHGDVEKNILSQPGYLLCRDAPPVVYMSGGALPVNTLQEVVSTLSLGKKAEVLVITDACRAGTLAGAATGGAQLTTANLAKQFANEVKILSCQSNEYSIEGEQWGGGRGAFSYYLEDALYGLADRDKDHQIRLKEIGRYLEDHVPAQTDPQVQNPIVVGDREALVAFVDEKMLAQWEDEKQQRQLNFSPGDMRGMAELMLAQADTNIQQIYQAYLAAVEAGELMKSAGGRKSANDYYEVLIHEPSIEQLHGFLKRNFVAALIDDSQQITNALLKTDPGVVSDNMLRPFLFDHIPAYLARATEILGEGHFIYKHLKAKQYYFEAKTCSKENFPGIAPDSLQTISVGKLQKALSFDSNAAYVYLELSLMYFYKLSQRQRALACAEKALALSPNWVLAHYAVGNCNRVFSAPKAEFHLQRALELDSTYLDTYSLLSQIYFENGNQEKMAFYRDKYIQKVKALIASDLEKVPVLYHELLGIELAKANRWEEAVEILQRAGEMSKGQFYGIYEWLGMAYSALGRYEDGLEAVKKMVELAPFNPNGYWQMVGYYRKLNQPLKVVETLEKAVSILGSADIETQSDPYRLALLGEALQELGRREEAKAQFQKILELLPNPHSDFEVNMKGRAHLGLGDLEAMQKTIDEGLKKFPGEAMVYHQAACLWSLAKNEKKALEWLELALEKGISSPGWLQMDWDLEWIRDKPGFRTLLKKYFPDQFKD